MAGQDIIVVGASAGGVETLSRLVTNLPEDLPAAVFIVLHMGPHTGSALPRILSRLTKLPVDHPSDGEPIRPGRIYVAVPDHHLILGLGAVRVTSGAKENGHRPSVDALFRSAAAGYGPRVVGVVLSGTSDDGTAGLRAIRARGGTGIVQHPDEALFPGMPQSALADAPDYVIRVGEIGTLLSTLSHEERTLERRPALTPDALDADADAELWTAYRALEERAALCRRLADRATLRQADITAQHFRADAAEMARQAEMLRGVLSSRGPQREHNAEEPAGSEGRAAERSSP